MRFLAGWLYRNIMPQKIQAEQNESHIEELAIPNKVLCAMENIVTSYKVLKTCLKVAFTYIRTFDE